MKRIFAIVFAVLMIVSMTACGKENDKNTDGSVATPDSAVVTTPDFMANDKVQTYVEENGEALVASVEKTFAESTGMTCTSTIKAVENGFIIDININELSEVTEEQKLQLQQYCDDAADGFEESLKLMQEELPELEYITLSLRDKDGVFLAAVNVGDRF